MKKIALFLVLSFAVIGCDAVGPITRASQEDTMATIQAAHSTPTARPTTTAIPPVDETVMATLYPPAGSQPPEAATATPNPEIIYHVVAPGETLSSIARYYDVTVEQLIRDNHIPNPDRIQVGQQIAVYLGAFRGAGVQGSA